MTLSSFDGVTAVVTGAAHGIGRALARQLASQGAGVVAVDVRRDDVEALVRELTDTGHRSLAVTCDVSCRSEVADLGRAVARWAPEGVQLLCNNAGVFTPRHVLTATHQDWQWVLGVCLWGTIHGVEEFLPGMVASGRAAHVLNTASMNGYVPNRVSALYSAAKYGVVGLSDTLRLELAGTQVGVTVLAPSAVRTNIGNSEEVRPSRFARTREDPPDDPFADYGLSAPLSPDTVAALALDGVRAGRDAVFTDPVVAPMLDDQLARLKGSWTTRGSNGSPSA
jgi:NAD(P)-dependent dehydrogenase (short-subunit alcohol dehydrogenase family)